MHAEILIIDDDESFGSILEALLAEHDYGVTWRRSAEEAIALLKERVFDAILTDVNMPGASGVELCAQIVESGIDVPVIVMTAYGNVETSIRAIRAGAYDFVTKPLDTEGLFHALDRALAQRALRREVKRLEDVSDETVSRDGIIGESTPMLEVRDLIARVAESDTSVLITGESGTGKELVARTLHDRSPRSAGPFIAINCAAMPEALLESEIFGHTRGAFTDARQARSGLFVKATGGTLFLDEIGEMPAGMQAKLLRALQERKVRPVGSDAEVEFDTRVVAATNRDLEAEVEKRHFRGDLFYRINVVHIHVPPLRERGHDVLLLAQFYLRRYANQGMGRVVGMTSAAAEKLLGHAWPGNVRELQNCVERAVALARLNKIGVDDLPDIVRKASPDPGTERAAPEELVPMDEIERRYLLRVLDAVGGNKTIASQVLGIDRRTLYRKLDAYAGKTKSKERSGEVSSATKSEDDAAALPASASAAR